MTETLHPCTAHVSTGTCFCSAFTKSPSKNGIWIICGSCNHTAQIHGIKVNALGKAESVSETVADIPVTVTVGDPVPAFREPSSVSQKDALDITPAAMRQWLRANGYSPGERGRLQPEHKRIALAALTHNV